MKLARPLVLLAAGLLGAPPLHAQEGIGANNLNQMFGELFGQFLGAEFVQGPGQHGQHYVPAADLANSQLVPALNSLISSNIASFPLNTTVAGVTFDFAGGQPVRVVESLGPIFAETASTVGAGRISLGFNATHLDLANFRGMSLENMAFTFPHQDVDTSAVLGDNPTEVDIVHVLPDLHATANIWAFYASYGVTSNLDVGVAVPFVDVRLEGNAYASIDSYTLLALGSALHRFGGTTKNPVLERDLAYDASAKGIGDIALRFKYRIPGATAVGLAALVDVRIPTGDEENFLGTGSTSARFILIGSRKIGNFTPHLNLGYDYRGADLDSDEVEFALGFDQKIGPNVTVAVDAIGSLDVQQDEAIQLVGEPVAVTFQGVDGAGVPFEATRTMATTNVRDRSQDNTLNLAFGARWALAERLQLLGNVLVPTMRGGLYSSVVPTIGFAMNL